MMIATTLMTLTTLETLVTPVTPLQQALQELQELQDLRPRVAKAEPIVRPRMGSHPGVRRRH